MVDDNGDGPESADCFHRTLHLMLGFLQCLENNDAHKASSVIRTSGSLRPAPILSHTYTCYIGTSCLVVRGQVQELKTFRGLFEHVVAGQAVTRI